MDKATAKDFNLSENTPQEFIDALKDVKEKIHDEIKKNQNAPAETLNGGIFRIVRNFAADIIEKYNGYMATAKGYNSAIAKIAGQTTKNDEYRKYCIKHAKKLCNESKNVSLDNIAMLLAEDFMQRPNHFRDKYKTTLGLQKGKEIDGYSPASTIYGWLLNDENLKKFKKNKN